MKNNNRIYEFTFLFNEHKDDTELHVLCKDNITPENIDLKDLLGICQVFFEIFESRKDELD